MKKGLCFKSSLVVAASGLSASAGHAAITTIFQNITLNYSAGSSAAFDITGDGIDDYNLIYANNTAQKPQTTSNPFSGGGGLEIQQIMFPNVTDGASNPSRTLPVLTAGQTVDGSLYGGYSENQAFFYENYDADYYGDWGGTPAGANPPNPVVGPIEGYIGLRIETSEGSSDWNYGYAHFSIDQISGQESITLLDTAYESTVNQGITIVNVVPEPSVAALVAGGLGLLALRLHRKRG